MENLPDYLRGGTQKSWYEPEDVVEVPCPLCGSEERTHLDTEYGAIGIVRCHSCDLVFTSPRVRDPGSVYWGDRDRYFEEARLIFRGSCAHHRDPNYLEELKLIERHVKPGRFLDVGCNMGMLLRLAVQRGWEGVGVEPSPPLASLASEELALTVHNCFLDDMPSSEEASFDVVALSDVLEHITEPVGFLRQASRLISPKGILFIKVPNVRWNFLKKAGARAMGKRSNQNVWDSYEHVVHYSDQTLRRMLEKGGFNVRGLFLARPVQIPSWHRYVGHYYQYPSPWILDWKRHLGRGIFHQLSRVERLLRFGSIGYFANSLVAIAEPQGE